ncbi:MAG TPA: cell division protein CrgA [Acidimicrobiia bacterium]|jgi:hypothetical protein|nr:cell division protein CrgA [Acidimicrobiia bacterium]
MPESKGRRTKKSSSNRRPTPPASGLKKTKVPSPRWYVWTMFGLMGAGVITVLLRYVVFTSNNLVLIGGLAALAAGFLMTTSYR